MSLLQPENTATEEQLAIFMQGTNGPTNHDQTVIERLMSHEDEPNMPSQIHDSGLPTPAKLMEANDGISGSASKNATQMCDFKRNTTDMGDMMSINSHGSTKARRPTPSISNQFKKPSFISRTS